MTIPCDAYGGANIPGPVTRTEPSVLMLLEASSRAVAADVVTDVAVVAIAEDSSSLAELRAGHQTRGGCLLLSVMVKVAIGVGYCRAKAARNE